MNRIVLPLPPSSLSVSKHPIVISSRVSITRNIDGLLFPHHLSTEEKILIENSIKSLLYELYPEEILTIEMGSLDTLQKLQMLTDLSITEHFLEQGVSLFAKKDGSWILLPNEQDHLYFFAIEFGNNLKEIYKRLSFVLFTLDTHIYYAYNSEFGYLSSNITKTGNALSFSVLINITGMELKGVLQNLINTCQESRFTLKSYDGHSGLFLLQNEGSSGIRELTHIDYINQLILHIQEEETRAKKEVLADQEHLTLLVEQIQSFLDMDLLSYSDMLQLIALVDFLNNVVYQIQDRYLWMAQIFRLHNKAPVFSHINDFEECNQQRAEMIHQLFRQIIILK